MALTHKVQPVLHGSVAEAMHNSVPAGLADREVFCLRLQEIYGAAIACEILGAMSSNQYRCYWLNPLQSSRLRGEDLGGEPVVSLAEVFQVPVDHPITQHPAASDGKIYIQNPSSYFAVATLAPKPEEEVLDLAAAPGGKTLAMAVRMQNTGRIAAVEPIRGRFHRMQANLRRCGVNNVQYYQRDGRSVGRAVPERFDRVLLDAPCSSESRMRWQDQQSFGHWSLRKVRETQRKQKSLLRSAYAALKPGGVMVYCTCSFAPEENELVVNALLRKSDAMLLAIANPPENSSSGLTQWMGKDLDAQLGHSLRITPKGPWDGFYLAQIAKPQ